MLKLFLLLYLPKITLQCHALVSVACCVINNEYLLTENCVVLFSFAELKLRYADQLH